MIKTYKRRSDKKKKTKVWSNNIKGEIKLARQNNKNKHINDIYYPEYDGVDGSGNRNNINHDIYSEDD